MTPFLGYVLAMCIAKQLPFNDCSFVSVLDSSVFSEDLSSSSSDLNCASLFLDCDIPSIRMAYLNVRSMLSVVDEVKNLVIAENINILAMTETWHG